MIISSLIFFLLLTWIKPNEMKWNRMWNANIAYRTEVYRISICFSVNNDDDDSKKKKEKAKRRKVLGETKTSRYTFFVNQYNLLMYHWSVCNIHVWWLTKKIILYMNTRQGSKATTMLKTNEYRVDFVVWDHTIRKKVWW